MFTVRCFPKIFLLNTTTFEKCCGSQLSKFKAFFKDTYHIQKHCSNNLRGEEGEVGDRGD